MPFQDFITNFAQGYMQGQEYKRQLEAQQMEKEKALLNMQYKQALINRHQNQDIQKAFANAPIDIKSGQKYGLSVAYPDIYGEKYSSLGEGLNPKTIEYAKNYAEDLQNANIKQQSEIQKLISGKEKEMTTQGAKLSKLSPEQLQQLGQENIISTYQEPVMTPYQRWRASQPPKIGGGKGRGGGKGKILSPLDIKIKEARLKNIESIIAQRKKGKEGKGKEDKKAIDYSDLYPVAVKKTIVKTGYSPSLKKKVIQYSDGTIEYK